MRLIRQNGRRGRLKEKERKNLSNIVGVQSPRAPTPKVVRIYPRRMTKKCGLSNRYCENFKRYAFAK